MFESIVVGLTGARQSDTSLPFALRLADQCHSRLAVARVHPAAPAFAGGMADWPHQCSITTIGPDANDDDFLDPAAAATEAIHRSDPARRSLLVLVGDEESTGGKGALGPLTERTLLSVEVPVLLVPGDHIGTPVALGLRPPRLLVALDQSGRDGSVLATAAAYASATQAHITLVTVVPANRCDPAAPALQHDRAAGRYLDRIASTLRDQGLSVAARLETSDEVGETLLDLVEHGFDVVVVARGAGVEGTTRLGEVAGRVARDARRPVLVAPAR